jgi:vancomycin resistance protein YoaR
VSATPATGPIRPAWLAVGAASIVLVLLVISAGVRVTHDHKILPGVSVEGISLGGATRSQARARLSTIAERTAHEPIKLVVEDRRLMIAPEEAGYVADVDATITAAIGSGRGGPLGGLWTTVAGLFGGRDVALVQRVESKPLARIVSSLTDRLGRRSFPGELVVDPADLAITTKPPRSGREVDRDEFAARLRAALRRRPRGTVVVPLRAVHVATAAQVDAVGRAARDYLDAPLTLTGAGEPLEVSPNRLAGALALEQRGDGRTVRLGAGDEQLAALVEELAAKRDRPARDARMNAPARVVTFDAKGDAPWRPRKADISLISKPRSGRTVQRKQLASAIESAIRAGRHEVRVQTKRVEPSVSAVDARELSSLIGTFTTYYVPAQPRVVNIKQIAAAVDGTIVAPHARFSLNETAGQRTKEGGYVEAPFIADGHIEPSIGGGVSQFSTTLYNAAYFAGLQIDGHRPHSFFIDRYPAGREATLNFPDIDMTWTNDTDTPVLIRTSTDDNSVAVSLYGNNGGRRVEAKTGDRMPVDGADFAVTVTREIRYPGGRTVQQPFTTKYDKPPADE